MNTGRADTATLGIVASNLLTLLTAWWQDWPLVLMLWPFWCQSLVIGWYARKRILALRKFSTEGFRINDRAVQATPETQRRTATFFALHYGLFHLVYVAFLLTMTASAMGSLTGDGAHPLPLKGLKGYDAVMIVALSVAFWYSHRASHREHVEADLRRTPNIGTLMFVPYLRVVPMHLAIILGMALGDDGGRLLFGTLKTVADVLMHKIEHRWLQGAAATKAQPGGAIE